MTNEEDVKAEQAKVEFKQFVNHRVGFALQEMTKRVIHSLLNIDGMPKKGYLLVAFDLTPSERTEISFVSNIDVKQSWPSLERIWEEIKKQVNGAEEKRVIIP